MPSNVANPEGEGPLGEKHVLDKNPTDSESDNAPEFKEGGYGWLVAFLSSQFHAEVGGRGGQAPVSKAG